MTLNSKITKILEKPVCDHCLGRCFAQLLSGFSNDQRGKSLRTATAMLIETGEVHSVDMSNFFDFKLRNRKPGKKKKCSICNGFFDNIDEWVKKAVKSLKGLEFETFLVGTRIDKDLYDREEEIWEKIGIEHCEPIKGEINREIGKRLEKILKKKANLKQPDISILVDLGKNKVDIKINPLYIFGYYQKLVRGIPQSRWDKYKTSVEEEIAKPIMKLTKGKNHKFHGAGREDVDALCLGWRPFVLEILEPKKREINLKKIKTGKKVKVKNLSFSDMETVRKVKDLRSDKTYKMLVSFSKPIKKSDLRKISKLKGSIKQQTPERVLHRRADLSRKRDVKTIKAKYISPKKIELTVKGTAGLYIKELVSGDKGRTEPSLSSLLEIPAICKKLDVIKIETKLK